MKAKVIASGIIYNFHQFGDDGNLWKCDETGSIYHRSGLIFTSDTIDWEQRRFLVAKDMLAAIESNSNPQMYQGAYEEQVEWAIRFADELIKQLKNETK